MLKTSVLKGKNILISGQVLNSLTEMVEDYLRDKTAALGVIGISSPYSPPGSARTTYYENGILSYRQRMCNIYFHKRRWYSQYFLTFVFLIYFCSILKSALQFKIKFDIFVGISCFSAFLGVILKWLGVVERVTYYSIDYYPLPRERNFEYIMTKFFIALDRFCTRYSDMVWHINPNIAEARANFGGMSPEKYRAIHVPLSYGKDLLSPKPFSEIERYTLGFVGTLSPNQGLQMAIRAFPKILKQFPQAKLEIIGEGVFGTELRKMVKSSPARHRIVFHGFINDRKKVSQILSHCALGIAPWTMEAENNIRYADPGKPKHYAFCGIPIVITKSNPVAWEIEKHRAGIAINYNEKEFIDAVLKILENEDILRMYRKNALEFAKKYISEDVYANAWNYTLVSI